MLKRLFIGLSVFFVLAAAFMAALVTRYPVKYYGIISRHAGRLEPVLICAVIHAESTFRPEARSGKGAIGLMQITEGTGIWMAEEMKLGGFNVAQLSEPEINIAIGCYYLNWLTDYYDGSLTLALCAYNAGMGNVNRWLKDPRYSADGRALEHIPFPETDQYISRIRNNTMIYDFILKLPLGYNQ